MLMIEIAVVGLLVLLNGFFAMSELAVVSARRGRLEQMAREGRRGAARALRLLDEPTSFLSTVQVGITLVGIFAGAFSGATLSRPLGDLLRSLPGLAGLADELAFGLVVLSITYLSLIVGELVPKRIALANAEAIAAFVAPLMGLLARLGAPVVWFLRLSTDAVLAVLRLGEKGDSTVTEEEVKSLIAEGTKAGVFEPAEKAMIEGVLRLADRSARSIMVPRPDVVWLEAGDPPEAVLDRIRASGHSRFPVSRGDIDHVLGVVHAKDLLQQLHRSGAIDLSAALRQPLYVAETMPALDLLERFRSAPVHMAVVVDEHGTFEGVVTPTDFLVAIAGALPERAGEEEPEAVRRADGSWLLDGGMAVEDVEHRLGVLGVAGEGDYATLAGFLLHRFGRIPEAGESVAWRGWVFEVVDLDRRRIDRVLARRVEEEET